ncbi:Hypothetical predicted protein [Mytilus galloprovincialis]|nr:Hypothetical predicted protein [Mytilus galloprovincialis]
MILRICCPLKQSIEALVEVRNKVRGHARNSKMSNEDFKNNWCIIEEKVPELLNHGIVDNMKKETANHEFTQRLKDLKVKPLTEESYRQVITALLQQNEIKQDMKELSENVQNLQSVAENTQAGVLNLQSLPGQVDGIEKKLTELLMRDRNTNSDIDTDAVPFLPEDEPGSQDRNTNSDIDTDAVPFLPEDEPGSQDRTTNSDLNSDSEPYLTETEPRSQGAEAVERRDERSVDRKEQTYIKTGVTGSEQTFRKDGYKYDTLVLHSEDDEEHVNEMIKMMEEKVDLPDVKIVSVGDDMVAGTSLFKSFFKLLDDSCTVLLFVTPSFYTDCWSDHRLETVLADRMKGSPCVIPVLYGEKKLRDELKVLGNIKTIIFFKEEDGDKYKSFITKITKALEHYRGKVNK